MSTVQAQPTRAIPVTVPRTLTVYNHSAIFYWWPVWVVGYVLALLTYFQGTVIPLVDVQVIMHPSKNLGVIYTVVFLLVLLMTHATVRGIASLTVIMTLLAVTFLFAYMGWWESFFNLFSALAIFMNLGFYVFFSSAVFIVWALAFSIFDRMDYWEFRPGQVVHHTVLGGGAQTFDTHGMSVFKLRDDLFRHWILGLGSGDLHIATSGAKKGEFVIPNVLFVGSKLERIEELVAMKPDEDSDNPVSVVVANA